MDCSPLAPLSMEFPRQEFWSGLPFLSLSDLPDPGTKPTSLETPALADGFFTTELPGKPKRRDRERIFLFSYLLIFIAENMVDAFT